MELGMTPAGGNRINFITFENDGKLTIHEDTTIEKTLVVTGLFTKTASAGAVEIGDGLIRTADTVGMKLAIYGTTYGIGIQNSVFQFINVLAGEKFVWGYGTSASLTETMKLVQSTKTLEVDNLKLAPDSSITPASNGDLVIEATNNTTLTFKLKGTDGVVRTGTLTLS